MIKAKNIGKGTETVFDRYCFSLFKNGTIAVSDGMAIIGELDRKETRELYEAMKKIFEKVKGK